MQVISYHYQWVISKPLMNACLTCAMRSGNSCTISAGLETSSAHSPGILLHKLRRFTAHELGLKTGEDEPKHLLSSVLRSTVLEIWHVLTHEFWENKILRKDNNCVVFRVLLCVIWALNVTDGAHSIESSLTNAFYVNYNVFSQVVIAASCISFCSHWPSQACLLFSFRLCLPVENQWAAKEIILLGQKTQQVLLTFN